MITFDGNKKSAKEANFQMAKLKEHLERKFKVKISCGTVVQLFIAGKRRRSVSRCNGVEKVLQKKSQEGFHSEVQSRSTLECCIFAALDDQQFHDGEKLLNLARDDPRRLLFRHHDHPQITRNALC